MADMISAPALNQPAAPLASRLLAWANERFPLENGVVVLLVTALGVLFGRALTHPGAVHLKAEDLAAFAAAWAYFLLLRVFDEHKDYELDLVNHPHRVLQSGRITLAHLRALGWAAAALPLVVSVAVDHGIGSATAMWALLMAWTLLMLKEFFIEWPPRWFVLYAFMHMLSMPLAFLWLARIGSQTGLPHSVRVLALLGAGIAASLEVARKFRAPEDERPTIDTYTSQLGVRGASLTLTVLSLGVGAAAAGLITDAVQVSTAVLAICLPLAVIPAAAGAGAYAADPTPARATAVEKLAGLSVLLVLLISLISLLAARGIA